MLKITIQAILILQYIILYILSEETSVLHPNFIN